LVRGLLKEIHSPVERSLQSIADIQRIAQPKREQHHRLSISLNKYLHITEDSIMHITDQQIDQDDTLDAQREIIRQSLDPIINDIGMAMRDVGLTFPVYITVRNSGDALVTMATPIDPSDEEWQQAMAIVCRTLAERVGCDRLRGRELACAIANAGAINAADVTAA
jgi:hypothetical protein